MSDASHVASFIGHEPSKALFIGLYKIGKARRLTHSDYWKVPEHLELRQLGMKGFSGIKRQSCLWFDLQFTDFYAEWKGKLVIGWPAPERSWWRRAHRNVMPIRAILEDSALITAMQRWDELDLSWNQLSILPKLWQTKLAEWRGVYYIYDTAAGKGYVGSAYGAENIFGRWRNYATTGHGGNRLLRERDPRNFRFTILQLTAPDMEAREVIHLESTWKERLHTRAPHGFNEN